MLVAPSILSSDFSKITEEINNLEKANADWIHIDVMDGNFVNNLTFGPKFIKDIRKHSKMFFDVHLMINNPDLYIDEYIDAGSDLITFHYEALENKKIESLIKKIKSFGIKVGISIKPNTSVNEIKPWINLIDLVLIMTVEPGFGGQSFMEDQINKIPLIKEINPNVLIEIDGGINDITIKKVKDVDVVVAGSYIFSGNYEDKIRSLK